MSVYISIILPTYNPDSIHLTSTLNALKNQTLPNKYWETLIVNNASTQFPNPDFFQKSAPQNYQVIEEPRLGLSSARARGLRAAKGELAIFVDDDNLLAPDYLEQALACFDATPTLGAIGGRIRPEFETTPPTWINNFLPILACWDHGEKSLITGMALRPPRGKVIYPAFAPVGAGMVLRRTAWETWLKVLDSSRSILSDRQGTQLSSGGDNEIVLTVLKAGWQVGYFPSLNLTHLIPESRLDPQYLARLNYGCSLGFTQALRRHDACPWSLISRWTLPLRLGRAWLRCRAWKSPANYIRWRGIAGHFAARVR